MPLDLYPHQEKAVNELGNGKILKGGVGSGKSRTAVSYYYERVVGGTLKNGDRGEDTLPTKPRDVFVITTAKKRDDGDWLFEFANVGISPDPHHSARGIRLTVDSWNNVAAYADVEGAFFIFDEQRLVGSGAWVKAFHKIAKSNQWIVLSATPGDSWMDYAPVFIANGWYRNRTEFVHRHVVYKNFSKFPKIDRYVDTGVLERHRRAVLVSMPDDRVTRRHIQSVMAGYDKDQFKRVWDDRWNIYEEEPLKDVADMFRVARKLVNSDPSRLSAVMRIVEKHPRLIIFYNFNYELDMLRTLGATLDIPVGEWNGQKHQDIPDGDRWLYLVQYTAGAEGWNCITTDAMVFFSQNYSYKVWEQAQGRIDRINTTYQDLYYYVIRSSSKIDQAIHKALTNKRNFNEKAYSKGWAPVAERPEDQAEVYRV